MHRIIGVPPLRMPARAPKGRRPCPINAYLPLFPSRPSPSLCDLLLPVRPHKGSLLQPSSHGRFLMPATPWTTTEKAAQTQ